MPKLAQDLEGIVNHKLDALMPSDIRLFDRYVSQYEGVIKLTLGEPDLDTPEHVKQAAIKDIEANDTHYAPQSGMPRLRQAISKYVKKLDGVDYVLATKIFRKFESLNLAMLRDELKELCTYLQKSFGKNSMKESIAYLERLRRLY